MANIAKRARDWFRNEDSRARPLARHNVSSSMPVSYFGPLSNFFWDMDRMFDNTFRSFGMPTVFQNLSQNLGRNAGQGLSQGMGMQMFNPNVDISSTNREYTVTFEVPGLDENDVRVEVSNDGTLTISGEKRQESAENRRDVYCTECSYGSFERTLTLPEDVDQEGIEARFKNGVLTVTCPRLESVQQSRRQIQIDKSDTGRGGENTRASNANERSAPAHQAQKKAA